MARRRFFVDQVRDGTAEITGDDAHHLVRVLRVEAGQKFELSDSHQVWLATVESVAKNRVQFSLDEKIETGTTLPPVTLYLALFKFERFEWAVEKATELGVARLIPVEAGRSEQGLAQAAKKRVERWRRVAKEASEQSRRLRAPEIAEAIKFAAALRDESACRVWLDEDPGAPPLLPALAGNLTSVAMMVGPEGGWSPVERNQFAQAGWQAASLGLSVLRAETAVCAAMAVFAQAVATIVKATPISK